MNLRNQQKFGMINELKIRPASVENKNEQKVSVIPEMGQNWGMWITVVAFVAVILLVNLIRTRSRNNARQV